MSGWSSECQASQSSLLDSLLWAGTMLAIGFGLGATLMHTYLHL
jgi:hypothetical protein